MRLLTLSDREYQRENNTAPAPQPATKKFKAVRLNLARYDGSWDRKRGSAARLMAVLLRESDDQLTERVCQDAQACRTYRGAADWLAGEAQYLRKLAAMMETASSRLTVVLQRCGHSASSPTP
jgi:hypothetical protein